MPKFLVVGDATVDQMYFVNEFPEPGGEVSAHRALLEPGGSGGTVATVLARLGNDTRIATRVGTGPFAELALRNAVAAGVDMRLVQHDEVHQTSSITL
ncbi:MAG TPA: carbohydrate kinase family protein, partial [Trueperaceae bacterium]